MGVVDKLLPIDEAIRGFVPSGSLVFVGGFGQGVPFASGREIIRQGVRNLTLCRTGADILFDLLVAAGVADHIIVGWFGNPGIGISHVCRKALRDGRLRLTETSNFGLLLQLEAAALGVPFLPTHVLQEGDLGRRADRKTIDCPFTGTSLSAVPALVPDVALVHAHRADRHGNTQTSGITGDTLAGARAAKSVVVTAEEIVDPSDIRADPGRTVIPAHRVGAVVHAPLGAWPSYVDGLYDRDDEFYAAFDNSSRDSGWVQAQIDAIRAGEHKADGARLAFLRERAGEAARVR